MSLNRRIILSATLVLVIFITLTALALERAFSDSTESALHDKMTTQLYALMAAAEVGTGPVDAVYKAIQSLVHVPATLLEYTVQSVTEGSVAHGRPWPAWPSASGIRSDR